MTKGQAAAEERSKILRKVREMVKGTMPGSPEYGKLQELIAWIKSRSERYNARPGGLGRKRSR